MKRYIIFIIIIVGIILTYTFIANQPKNYDIQYQVADFNVKETYDKGGKLYNFTIQKDDSIFYYVSNRKYSRARKIVENIEVVNNENTLCITPKIKNDMMITECLKDGEYIAPHISGISEFMSDASSKQDSYANVDIYDKSYDYVMWDGYGLKIINSQEERHFLTNESYVNPLAYQMDNYIIFANYDESRTFNTFYIYNNEDKTMTTWDIEYDIDYDSYYMGDVDGLVYLLDQKNKVQYQLNIKKQKIKIVSDEDGLRFYDQKWLDEPLDKYLYAQIPFNYNSLTNFTLKDHKLYFSYVDSPIEMRITDREVTAIVSQSENTVFYLSGDCLYAYNIYDGERLLLSYFDWNFVYENRIYIF